MAYPNGQQTDINSELFAPLVTAAQFQAYESSIARQMVTVFDAPAGQGKALQIPVWAGVSASIITDESAASLVQTNTTSASLTLTEHVVYHQVTDMLRDSSFSNVMMSLGDQSGRAIAESMDKQVFALFSSFTEAGPGAGAELTPTDILKAAATLRSAKLTGPFVAVIHPKQAYAIKDALTKTLVYNGTNTSPSYGNALSDVGESVLRNFYIGNLGGVMIYESALLTVDGSGDAVGAVFAPSAIAHAMRGGVSMETQRQAAARATDVVVKAVAGATIINTAHGVKLTADATL